MNNVVLLQWGAENKGPINDSGDSVRLYRCVVRDVILETEEEFDVLHNRDLGAAKLASSVLQRYYISKRVTFTDLRPAT